MSIAQYRTGRRLHYGWVVVGVTFLTLLTTAGEIGWLITRLDTRCPIQVHWRKAEIVGKCHCFRRRLAP